MTFWPPKLTYGQFTNMEREIKPGKEEFTNTPSNNTKGDRKERKQV